MLGFLKKIVSKKNSTSSLQKRGFDAGARTRLTASWSQSAQNYDRDIFQNLSTMRGRSRDLFQNSDYIKRFLTLLNTHVIGPKGILVQCAFHDSLGNLEAEKSEAIEVAFRRWGRRGKCDVTGKFSFRDVQRLVLQGMARDGEAIIRLLHGQEYESGLCLQLIDPSLLDENLNKAPDGSQANVRMGIELDDWGKPVAYYFKSKKDDSDNSINYIGVKYTRIPAEQILHIFQHDMPQQTRGVPWLHTSMTRLKMLSGYEEAELVAARVASSKMGFFKRSSSTGYDGDDLEKDEHGHYITEAQPGSFELLPEGVEFQQWDPSHPSGNFASFVKALLRGISSGLNVSYNSLANDLENVSYSSLRSSLLEDRDHYSVLQNFMIEALVAPIYERWLQAAALSRKLPIKPQDIDRYLEPQFVGRRWQWIDPIKDTKANIMAIDAGIKSRGEVIAEQGRSVDDVFREVASEKHKMEKYGLSFNLAGDLDHGGRDDEDDDGELSEAETVKQSNDALN